MLLIKFTPHWHFYWLPRLTWCTGPKEWGFWAGDFRWAWLHVALTSTALGACLVDLMADNADQIANPERI